MSCLTKTYHQLHTAASIGATLLSTTKIRLARWDRLHRNHQGWLVPLTTATPGAIGGGFSFLGGGNLGFLHFARAVMLHAPRQGVAGNSPRSHTAAFLIRPEVLLCQQYRKSCIPPLSHIHSGLFYYSSLLLNPLLRLAEDRNTSPYTAGSEHRWTSPLPEASQPSRIHQENKIRE